jgi:hypothetical protein
MIPLCSRVGRSDWETRIRSIRSVPLEYVEGGLPSVCWVVRGSARPQVLMRVAMEPSWPSGLIGYCRVYCRGQNNPCLPSMDSLASIPKIISDLLGNHCF